MFVRLTSLPHLSEGMNGAEGKREIRTFIFNDPDPLTQEERAPI